MAIESCPDLASRDGRIVRIAECVLLVLSLRQSYLHQNPNFRRNVLRELKKIKTAWPDLNYSMAPGMLILYPSNPAIPPAPDPLRLAG